MSGQLLPPHWQTRHLSIADSTLDDVPELQTIYDANPAIWGWSGVEAQEGAPHPMSLALSEGAQPPQGSQERFRLQSIRTRHPGQLIGVLAVYHGFPSADTLWLNLLAFYPRCQRRGYGTELLGGLRELVRGLESYTRMQTSVNLKNAPSLRLCVAQGFDKIVRIASPDDQADAAELHMILEKSLSTNTKVLTNERWAV